ncbi:MAG: 23S rRNA (guanosine(2251)-2'-O)-methyltransferase RlmB [Bacteroidales bacterium]|nr:23S rRNA (guanosine(2251)-2'-O)-methyltransferase RlmB [Bacteroidales bacterium]MDZ4204932.1 23S rRNA (guanosine(2251)-2'-O)-methyltransferase RlmB [Bacteroidales bacterium]
MKKNYPARNRTEQIVYGVHSVTEALNTGKEIEKVLIQNGAKGEWIPSIRKILNDRDIPLQYLPLEAMNRIVKGNHQGIAAFISPVQYQNIESIIPFVYESGQTPLIVVLDRITDVRNMGAIARTAECCGVHALVMPSRGSAQINADAIKTSSGALLTLPVVRSMNLKETLNFMKESGLQLIAATEKGKTPLWQASFKVPTAIIVGSEESGVSPEYLKLCDATALIPLTGSLASLNVSVAAAMFLYEVIRQRAV